MIGVASPGYPARHRADLYSCVEIETQIQDGVFSNGNVLTLSAGNFALKLAVESAVKRTPTLGRVHLIRITIGDVQLVKQKLEILVGILLLIASQFLVSSGSA